MDNKSWQEEYAKLTRPFYEEWYFWPLLILSLVALIFCGKAYQIYAADIAASEQESNIAYHSTSESSVDTSEIYSSEETSSESHSEESHLEESSESAESSSAEESSSESVEEVITPPPKTPQKIPAPENSVPKNSSEIVDIPEDSSEESSSEEEVSVSSEEIPEESSEENLLLGDGTSGESSDGNSNSGGNSTPHNPFCTIDCNERYIANINTKKFHYRRCSSVKQMLPQHKGYCNNRDAIIKLGYSPCKRCDP